MAIPIALAGVVAVVARVAKAVPAVKAAVGGRRLRCLPLE
jgi:hypothetical protein